MGRIPAWFERKFVFMFRVEQYPNVCARLRGTPARLEEIVRGVSREALLSRPKGKWSAQKHADHLLDQEPLWAARLRDFLGDGQTLSVADLSNRKTDEANYNAQELQSILKTFRLARLNLIDSAEKCQPALFARILLHPRLKQPMRLVDHLYFVAEHDDHHLARIWELIHA